jgi:MFS family permease
MTSARSSVSRLGSNYWKLLSTTAATNLGDGFFLIAIPWLASALTRDPLQIALVTLVIRVPWLLFSLPAGVITDRYDRRLLVAWMDSVRMVAIFAFGLVVLANHVTLNSPEEIASGASEPPPNAPILLGLLYLTALVIGTAEVLRSNAAQTLLPSIVEKKQLERANGRLWGAETVMNQFVGPPLAGLLLAIALALPFLVNAGLYAVGAALVFALVGTFVPKGQKTSGRIAWRSEVMEGLRAVWRHPLLRPLVVLNGAANALTMTAMAVYVLYVQEVLGLDARAFGLVVTGTAFGGLAGSLVADRVSRRVGSAPALLASLVVTAAGLAGLGLISSGVLAWLLGLALGFSVVIWNVITVSLRQAITPDHMLGRVNSVYRFFGRGTLAIGILLNGLLVFVGEPLLGREWALRAPFLVAAAGYLALFFYGLPRVTNNRVSAETSTPPLASDASS